MIGVRGIDNVLVDVGDLDVAVRFYTELLGLPVRMRFDDAGLVLFALGDETPGLLARLNPARSAQPPTASPRLWLEVPDARQAADTLTARGEEPLTAPFAVHTGWTVEVADPWGNVIGLTDYTRRPEHGREVRHRLA